MDSLRNEISKEEKEKLLNEKMEAIRKKNEELKKRHEEVEADKKLADKYSASVQISEAKPYVMKPPRPRPEKVYNISGSEGAVGKENIPSSNSQDFLSRQRLSDNDGPPPDPSYRFLADPGRDSVLEGSPKDLGGRRGDKSARKEKRNRGKGKDPESEFSGEEFFECFPRGTRGGRPERGRGIGDKEHRGRGYKEMRGGGRERGDHWERKGGEGASGDQNRDEDGAYEPLFSSSRFTTREGPNRRDRGRGGFRRGGRRRRGAQQWTYEQWKAERDAIDEARLIRARAGDGEWRREWDMQKTDQPIDDDDDPRFPRNKGAGGLKLKDMISDIEMKKLDVDLTTKESRVIRGKSDKGGRFERRNHDTSRQFSTDIEIKGKVKDRIRPPNRSLQNWREIDSTESKKEVSVYTATEYFESRQERFKRMSLSPRQQNSIFNSTPRIHLPADIAFGSGVMYANENSEEFARKSSDIDERLLSLNKSHIEFERTVDDSLNINRSKDLYNMSLSDSDVNILPDEFLDDGKDSTVQTSGEKEVGPYIVRKEALLPVAKFYNNSFELDESVVPFSLVASKMLYGDSATPNVAQFGVASSIDKGTSTQDVLARDDPSNVLSGDMCITPQEAISNLHCETLRERSLDSQGTICKSKDNTSGTRNEDSSDHESRIHDKKHALFCKGIHNSISEEFDSLHKDAQSTPLEEKSCIPNDEVHGTIHEEELDTHRKKTRDLLYKEAQNTHYKEAHDETHCEEMYKTPLKRTHDAQQELSAESLFQNACKTFPDATSDKSREEIRETVGIVAPSLKPVSEIEDFIPHIRNELEGDKMASIVGLPILDIHSSVKNCKFTHAEETTLPEEKFVEPSNPPSPIPKLTTSRLSLAQSAKVTSPVKNTQATKKVILSSVSKTSAKPSLEKSFVAVTAKTVTASSTTSTTLSPTKVSRTLTPICRGVLTTKSTACTAKTSVGSRTKTAAVSSSHVPPLASFPVKGQLSATSKPPVTKSTASDVQIKTFSTKPGTDPKIAKDGLDSSLMRKEEKKPAADRKTPIITTQSNLSPSHLESPPPSFP